MNLLEKGKMKPCHGIANTVFFRSFAKGKSIKSLISKEPPEDKSG